MVPLIIVALLCAGIAACIYLYEKGSSDLTPDGRFLSCVGFYSFAGTSVMSGIMAVWKWLC